jgi:hypothetical protein
MFLYNAAVQAMPISPEVSKDLLSEIVRHGLKAMPISGTDQIGSLTIFEDEKGMAHFMVAEFIPDPHVVSPRSTCYH